MRGTRYTAIPILTTDGILDVYLHYGTMNGNYFIQFLHDCLLPVLQPFNWVNPRSVVIIDNASIHHVEQVRDLIETQAASKLYYHSPDLNPAEGIFSPVKTTMRGAVNRNFKDNHSLDLDHILY